MTDETPVTRAECTAGQKSGKTCRTVTLRTPRLMLRAPHRSDVPALVRLLDDRRIAAMTSRIPHPYGEKDASAWLTLLDRPDNAEEVFLLERNSPDANDGPAVIGACGTMPANEGVRELGYWLGFPFWHRGYATEAAGAVVDHTFRTAPVASMSARCRADNPASRRVLEKCGFVLADTGTCSSRVDGDNLPALFFSLTRTRWAAER